MRFVIALVIVAASAACSSSGDEAGNSFNTSPSSASVQQVDPDVSETEGSSVAAPTTATAPTTTATTSAPLPPLSSEADPFVGTGQISTASRSSEGALVVTVTGYEWGSEPCQGLYAARITDPVEAIVEVTEAVGRSDDGACDEIGFEHALTVVGGADIEAAEIVDAFDGTTLAVSVGVEQLRPSWFTDRSALTACGTDADDQSNEQNTDARSCFLDAYSTRTPAELEVISFGDEGESAHRLFRIVDADRLEVLEEFRPPVNGDVTTASPWTWSTYQCESFVFLDEPGFEVDRRPLLNANGECSVERTQL